jgi:hypothetical protein
MALRSSGMGVQVTWATLPGKPSAFVPAAHTHAWGDVIGKPSTFAPSAHTHLWADITDKPATFPPATHTHSGLLQFVGNVTVTETTLLALGLGMKRMTLPLAGITSADMGKLVVIPNGTATTGCEVQNAYPTTTAGQVSIGYFTPALGLAATYSIPVSVWRIT